VEAVRTAAAHAESESSDNKVQQDLRKNALEEEVARRWKERTAKDATADKTAEQSQVHPCGAKQTATEGVPTSKAPRKMILHGGCQNAAKARRTAAPDDDDRPLDEIAASSSAGSAVIPKSVFSASVSSVARPGRRKSARSHDRRGQIHDADSSGLLLSVQKGCRRSYDSRGQIQDAESSGRANRVCQDAESSGRATRVCLIQIAQNSGRAWRKAFITTASFFQKRQACRSEKPRRQIAFGSGKPSEANRAVVVPFRSGKSREAKSL